MGLFCFLRTWLGCFIVYCVNWHFTYRLEWAVKNKWGVNNYFQKLLATEEVLISRNVVQFKLHWCDGLSTYTIVQVQYAISWVHSIPPTSIFIVSLFLLLLLLFCMFLQKDCLNKSSRANITFSVCNWVYI